MAPFFSWERRRGHLKGMKDGASARIGVGVKVLVVSSPFYRPR